jgi:tRNA (adenine22-N1)-methyltransferase
VNISKRLKHIVNLIPKCNCLADIGTDHGYIPIYTTLNGISKSAIASDINEGPLMTAEKNIWQNGLSDRIDVRLGGGLSVLKRGEADVIVIAGMGGNLIVDIIERHVEIARNAKFLVLQPVQYPEVLRVYLVNSGFNIIDEDLVKDEGKYYQIIKATNEKIEPYNKEVYYHIGAKLIEKNHPLLKEYINYKLRILNNILSQISDSQHEKYQETLNLKKQFEEVLTWL